MSCWIQKYIDKKVDKKYIDKIIITDEIVKLVSRFNEINKDINLIIYGSYNEASYLEEPFSRMIWDYDRNCIDINVMMFSSYNIISINECANNLIIDILEYMKNILKIISPENKRFTITEKIIDKDFIRFNIKLEDIDLFNLDFNFSMNKIINNSRKEDIKNIKNIAKSEGKISSKRLNIFEQQVYLEKFWFTSSILNYSNSLKNTKRELDELKIINSVLEEKIKKLEMDKK